MGAEDGKEFVVLERDDLESLCENARQFIQAAEDLVRRLTPGGKNGRS
jgi:hypothetical protein